MGVLCVHSWENLMSPHVGARAVTYSRCPVLVNGCVGQLQISLTCIVHRSVQWRAPRGWGEARRSALVNGGEQGKGGSWWVVTRVRGGRRSRFRGGYPMDQGSQGGLPGGGI